MKNLRWEREFIELKDFGRFVLVKTDDLNNGVGHTDLTASASAWIGAYFSTVWQGFSMQAASVTERKDLKEVVALNMSS
jgi:hypothetical protein